jgi:hypothetical protein
MSSQSSFLLFNASNLLPGPGSSVPLLYPYAFVQLREIADRHGISIKSLDVSVLEGSELIWQRLVKTLIVENEPVAIGITIRQVDSLNVFDSLDGKVRFDPIGLTKRLIKFLRTQTTAPIILGGFGFTAMTQPLFDLLRPDYGICGEPDGLFAALPQVLQGRDLSQVPNLVYWSGDKIVVNPRQYYPPASRREYTTAVLEDIQRFYGTHRLYSPQQTMGLPVELARGCPFSCSFCIEPLVKGRQERIRDPDVVMEDVEFLARQGIAKFWLICSEINIRNTDLILNMAERMTRLREKYGTHLAWNAYLLPREFSRNEIATVANSGFLGAGNDYVSMDPATMKAARLPYNIKQSMSWLETYKTAGAILSPNGIRDWSIFLGHEGNGPDSIRTTLETLLSMNVLEYYEKVLTINATRVFDIQQRKYEEQYLYRVLPDDKDGIGPLNINTFPTYYYNKLLVDALGGIDNVEVFFRFLECTILSNQTRTGFDAGRFLREALSANEFRSLFLEHCLLTFDQADIDLIINRRVTDPRTIEAATALCEQLSRSELAGDPLRQLWSPSFAEHDRFQVETAAAASRILLLRLFAGWQNQCDRVLEQIGFAGLTAQDIWTTPSFVVHKTLFNSFGSQAALEEYATDQIRNGSLTGVSLLFYRFLLAFKGVVLKPEYRPFFCSPEPLQVE